MVTSYHREKTNWSFERFRRSVKKANITLNDNDNDNEEIKLFNPVCGLNPDNEISNKFNLSRLKNNSSPTMDRHIKAFTLPPGTVTSIDCEC